MTKEKKEKKETIHFMRSKMIVKSNDCDVQKNTSNTKLYSIETSITEVEKMKALIIKKFSEDNNLDTDLTDDEILEIILMFLKFDSEKHKSLSDLLEG